MRWWVGGVIAAAVILVAVLAAISSRSGDAKPSGSSGKVISLAGIPQAGPVLGRADAPVEITEFADLQCPACRQAASGILPNLIDKWVRPGTARLRFSPMSFVGPDSVRGARAAIAAGNQNVLWQFVERVYQLQGTENTGWLSDSLIRDVARQAGADTTRLDADREAATAATELAAASAVAQQAGVQSTPSFLVRGARGQQMVVGVPSQADIDAAIEAAR
jgi:protein-disulfide isomerase